MAGGRSVGALAAPRPRASPGKNESVSRPNSWPAPGRSLTVVNERPLAEDAFTRGPRRSQRLWGPQCLAGTFAGRRYGVAEARRLAGVSRRRGGLGREVYGWPTHYQGRCASLRDGLTATLDSEPPGHPQAGFGAGAACLMLFAPQPSGGAWRARWLPLRECMGPPGPGRGSQGPGGSVLVTESQARRRHRARPPGDVRPSRQQHGRPALRRSRETSPA